METSPESVNSHMLFSLFYFICSLLIFKSQTTSIMPPIFSSFLKNKLYSFTRMFLPPTSIFDPTIYPFADKPYLPAILVKHHTWFFPDADLFISLDGVLYGVHQFYFNSHRCSKKSYTMEKQMKLA
jgi:hypothetical protein